MQVPSYLLFGLCTSAGPFDDNILFGLGIGRKGEGHA